MVGIANTLRATHHAPSLLWQPPPDMHRLVIHTVAMNDTMIIQSLILLVYVPPGSADNIDRETHLLCGCCSGVLALVARHDLLLCADTECLGTNNKAGEPHTPPLHCIICVHCQCVCIALLQIPVPARCAAVPMSASSQAPATARPAYAQPAPTSPMG
jgi:hypothetical protein